MIDIDWLMDQLPVLLTVPTLISHGEKSLVCINLQSIG